MTMAQPRISQFVKDSENPSGTDQSLLTDNQPTNQDIGGREPVTGVTNGQKSSKATVSKKGQDSKSKKLTGKRKRAGAIKRPVMYKSTQPQAIKTRSDKEIPLTQFLGESLN